MPMKMGIHCKPIGHGHSTSLDSRVRGNDGGMFFSRKRLISNPVKSFVAAALQRPQTIVGFYLSA
jgi:hypothetical protein